MHITKIITVAILFVFLFAVSSVPPLLPAEPEKPAEESAGGKIREEEWPEGFAFEQLEKIKTTGRDVLYYAVVRRCQIVGWAKVEYDLGVWEKRPAVRVKVTAEMRDPSYGRAHMEDTSYYDLRRRPEYPRFHDNRPRATQGQRDNNRLLGNPRRRKPENRDRIGWKGRREGRNQTEKITGTSAPPLRLATKIFPSWRRQKQQGFRYG